MNRTHLRSEDIARKTAEKQQRKKQLVLRLTAVFNVLVTEVIQCLNSSYSLSRHFSTTIYTLKVRATKNKSSLY